MFQNTPSSKVEEQHRSGGCLHPAPSLAFSVVALTSSPVQGKASSQYWFFVVWNLTNVLSLTNTFCQVRGPSSKWTRGHLRHRVPHFSFTIQANQPEPPRLLHRVWSLCDPSQVSPGRGWGGRSRGGGHHPDTLQEGHRHQLRWSPLFQVSGTGAGGLRVSAGQDRDQTWT